MWSSSHLAQKPASNNMLDVFISGASNQLHFSFWHLPFRQSAITSTSLKNMKKLSFKYSNANPRARDSILQFLRKLYGITTVNYSCERMLESLAHRLRNLKTHSGRVSLCFLTPNWLPVSVFCSHHSRPLQARRARFTTKTFLRR